MATGFRILDNSTSWEISQLSWNRLPKFGPVPVGWSTLHDNVKTGPDAVVKLPPLTNMQILMNTPTASV